MSSPNWAEIVTAITYIVIAVTALAAFRVAWIQLGYFREQTQVQHLIEFARDFSSEPLVSYRCELARKRRAGEVEPSELYRVLDFLEFVGLFVRRGYLRASDVWEEFSYWVLIIFADSQHLINEHRADDPTVYKNLVWLVDEMRRIERREKGSLLDVTQEDIEGFWEEEAEIQSRAPVATRRKRQRKV